VPLTLGIIGGLGPEATVDFFGRVVRATPARTDQEHLRILIDNHPQIAGRVAAILANGPSPVPGMLASARLLQQAGADFLAVPCNTAHYFLPELQKQITLPFVDMITEVVQWLGRTPTTIRKVGLMASTATLQVELYQQPMRAAGLMPLVPPPELQELLMSFIFDLKAGVPHGELRPRVLRVMASLLAQGAEAIVAGCTEVPLLMGPADVPVAYADGNAILAEACVRYAMAGA
jgi:aspartate racemase